MLILDISIRFFLMMSNTLFFSLKILWVIKSYCLPVFSNAFFFYIMLKRINRKKYSLLCISTLQTFVVFQLFSQLSHVWLFVTPCAAAYQASLSITNPQSLLKLMSIKSVMPSNHLIPYLLLPSLFPSIRVFPMSQFFASGSHSIGVSASASVLPMNIQDWLPLGWIGLISLQSRGLSTAFSSTTVQKHQFFGARLSL